MNSGYRNMFVGRILVSIKNREFIYQVNECQLSKEMCVSYYSLVILIPDLHVF